jgi:hypothetical protein
MLQLVPSQRSTREPWSDWPTAIHAVDEVHETPDRTLNCPLTGAGVVCTVHAAPSHCSVSEP